MSYVMGVFATPANSAGNLSSATYEDSVSHVGLVQNVEFEVIAFSVFTVVDMLHKDAEHRVDATSPAAVTLSNDTIWPVTERLSVSVTTWSTLQSPETRLASVDNTKSTAIPV